MKRFLSLVLTFSMLLCMIPSASAASAEATAAANELYTLGLFQGKGTNANGNPIFALDDVPTRHEAVTMLVRLLGKEDEAKAGSWNIPFTDVDAWAKPYVGYAYANGLTTGTGATTFGGKATISATQYLTFVLRALGYQSGTDFQWDKAWELTDKLGLTHGEYPSDDFLRGDIALISAGALDQKLKNSETTLRSVVTAPAAPNEISLFLAPLNSNFPAGSNLGINSGTHPFQVRLNGSPVSSFEAALENPSAAKLTVDGSNLTVQITAPGKNSVTITAGGTSACFDWTAASVEPADPFSTGIVLRDPFKGGYFFPDKATGLLYGTFIFEVRLDGQPVSEYTAVLEKDDGCAAIVTSGGRLELRIKKGSTNAVNITMNGQTARFFWEN